MTIRIILIVHALVTFAAGLVLIINPELIPSAVHISLSGEQYLLCYFLAAAEIAIAYLSFASTKLSDAQSLKMILATFIIFHLTTGLLELYALSRGASFKLLGNVILRMLISAAFSYFYFRKKSLNR